MRKILTLCLILLCCTDGLFLSDQYCKMIDTPATDQIPAFSFELTGRIDKDHSPITYYPVKMLITTSKGVLQEIEFNEEDFNPCTLDDFGFEIETTESHLKG